MEISSPILTRKNKFFFGMNTLSYSKNIPNKFFLNTSIKNSMHKKPKIFYPLLINRNSNSTKSNDEISFFNLYSNKISDIHRAIHKPKNKRKSYINSILKKKININESKIKKDEFDKLVLKSKHFLFYKKKKSPLKKKSINKFNLISDSTDNNNDLDCHSIGKKINEKNDWNNISKISKFPKFNSQKSMRIDRKKIDFCKKTQNLNDIIAINKKKFKQYIRKLNTEINNEISKMDSQMKINRKKYELFIQNTFKMFEATKDKIINSEL